MDVDNPREVTDKEAKEAWEADPIAVFQMFRNESITLVEIVALIHFEASEGTSSTRVSAILEPMHLFFDACRCTAKNIWWATPISHFLTRPVPIRVNCVANQPCRYDGACYHEVAINLADGLAESARASWTAADYTKDLRFYTARGDFVRDYLKSLVAEIRSECHVGMERFGSEGRRFTNSLRPRPARIEYVRGGTSDSNQSIATVPGLRPFIGGEIAVLVDRVQFCGFDICSGPRSNVKRRVLELLCKKGRDGKFEAYSGEKIAEMAGLKGGNGAAAAVIRDLRDDITEALRNGAQIECGRKDVILSGGPGYRLSEKLSVLNAAASSDTRPWHSDEPGSDPGDAGELGRGPGDTGDPGCDHEDNGGPDRMPAPHGKSKDPIQCRQSLILEEIALGRKPHASEIAKALRVPLPTVKRDLADLKRRHKIRFEGSNRAGGYVLVDRLPALASPQKPRHRGEVQNGG
jgi:hypothetical protein